MNTYRVTRAYLYPNWHKEELAGDFRLLFTLEVNEKDTEVGSTQVQG